MNARFKTFIKEHLPVIDQDELDEIYKIFVERQFKKGGKLKEAGKICKYLGFIVSGSISQYVISQKGNIKTFQITDKPNFVTDVFGVYRDEPNELVIECLEDSILLIARMEDVLKLNETSLRLNQLLLKVTTKNLVTFLEMQITFSLGSSDENYQFILDKYPEFIKKFPLKLIASILDITPTQMSRVRRNLMK